MILPSSVQDLRRARRIKNGTDTASDDKRIANRRYRRQLNETTRLIEIDPERFDGEPFNVKCYTSWDLI
jgi:hypothetical protein